MTGHRQTCAKACGSRVQSTATKNEKRKMKNGRRSREARSAHFAFRFSFVVFRYSARHANLRLRTRAPPALLARLLVVRDALDVLGEAFLLTGLLEPPQQLFRGLVAATLDLDHRGIDPFTTRILLTGYAEETSVGANGVRRREPNSVAECVNCSSRPEARDAAARTPIPSIQCRRRPPSRLSPGRRDSAGSSGSRWPTCCW